jgi:phosphoribosylformylglycinamidine synthase
VDGVSVPRVHIAVMPKDELLDPQGQAIERALPALGFDRIRGVRVGKHIVVDIDDGDDLPARVEALAGQLLANPLLERFTWRIAD